MPSLHEQITHKKGRWLGWWIISHLHKYYFWCWSMLSCNLLWLLLLLYAPRAGKIFWIGRALRNFHCYCELGLMYVSAVVWFKALWFSSLVSHTSMQQSGLTHFDVAVSLSLFFTHIACLIGAGWQEGAGRSHAAPSPWLQGEGGVWCSHLLRLPRVRLR